VAEAIDVVASKRDGDGRWLLEPVHPGEIPVEGFVHRDWGVLNRYAKEQRERRSV